MIITYSILAALNFILFGMLASTIGIRRSEQINVPSYEYFNSLVCLLMGIFMIVCLIGAVDKL